MPTALNDDEQNAEADGDERGPHVRGDAEGRVAAGVDPDRLEPAPAEPVPDQVDAEGAPPAEVGPPLEKKDDRDADDVPDDLVQEQGVKQRSGRQVRGEHGIRREDLQPPRQGGGQAEELVVEDRKSTRLNS